MQLESKMPFKMQKIIFFFSNEKINICVPTQPKIFRPVTRKTLFALLAAFVRM